MKIFNKVSIGFVSLSLGLVLPFVALAAGGAAVNLGTAGNFVILAKTGISSTGTTAIVGDIGVSPAQATYITGNFALTLPAASAFSTSALVTGKVYAPGYAVPTPANLTTAVLDMQNAYTDAASRAPTVTDELGAGNIGGLTLVPGVYKWGTNVTIPTNLTLSGGANDVWIFQIAQNLTVSSAVNVVLSGGAQASNVFWQVAGQTTLGTTSVFNGNILDQTSIVLNTGATLNGRALAQSAVTLDSNAVTVPAGGNVNSDSNSNSNSNSNTNTNTDTNINSNSNVDSASNVNSANSAPNSIESGCSNNNVYNTSTGALCINNAVPQGCSGGNLYNISTGQLCMNNSGSITPTSYNFGTVTLKNGSKGNAVMELQRFLNAKLNLGLVVDGKLGPKTINVIKKWQKDNGLVADGLIGAKTKAQMNAQTQ